MAIPIGAIIQGASNAMGLFSNIFGNLFGSGGGSNATTQLNRDDTQWMYNQQSEQWRNNTAWYNRRGYELMREGLENAGYNPLMALGAQPVNGATVSGSVMDSKQNALNFDLPKSILQSLSDIKNTSADTVLKYAQAEENISRSNLENVQKLLADKKLPYANRMELSTLMNLEVDYLMKQATIRNVNADTQLKGVQSNLSRSQISQINANIELLRNQGIISSKQAQYLLKHPKQAMWTAGISNWTGAFGNLFSSNFNFK